MMRFIKNSKKVQKDLPSTIKNGAGFTLIELILYVSILTIMLSAIIPFAWDVIGSSAKSATQQEVNTQARYVSERIKYEIRRASEITAVTPTSLNLTNFSPDTTTVIDILYEKIRINKNGGGEINLNSDNTTISSLTFTDYRSADSKTKNIQFTFTLNSLFGSAGQKYTATTTIESDAEMRSN